jgi:hypothetical protein
MWSDSERGFGEVVREALRGEEIVDMMWMDQIVMVDVGGFLWRVQTAVGFVW